MNIKQTHVAVARGFYFRGRGARARARALFPRLPSSIRLRRRSSRPLFFCPLSSPLLPVDFFRSGQRRKYGSTQSREGRRRRRPKKQRDIRAAMSPANFRRVRDVAYFCTSISTRLLRVIAMPDPHSARPAPASARHVSSLPIRSPRAHARARAPLV